MRILEMSAQFYQGVIIGFLLISLFAMIWRHLENYSRRRRGHRGFLLFAIIEDIDSLDDYHNQGTIRLYSIIVFNITIWATSKIIKIEPIPPGDFMQYAPGDTGAIKE